MLRIVGVRSYCYFELRLVTSLITPYCTMLCQYRIALCSHVLERAALVAVSNQSPRKNGLGLSISESPTSGSSGKPTRRRGVCDERVVDRFHFDRDYGTVLNRCVFRCRRSLNAHTFWYAVLLLLFVDVAAVEVFHLVGVAERGHYVHAYCQRCRVSPLRCRTANLLDRKTFRMRLLPRRWPPLQHTLSGAREDGLY